MSNAQTLPRRQASELFALGNIVRLCEPYKPDPDKDSPWSAAVRDFLKRTQPELSPGAIWRTWKGFTHGIVVEHLANRFDQPFRVSLHLFDPEAGVIYTHGMTIPTYTDFHVSELVPHRIAGEDGYETLPEGIWNPERDDPERG